MTASTFLLDFLYPDGAAVFLQRLRPSFLQRFEPNQLASGRPSARPFTSSAPDPPKPPLPPPEEPEETVPPIPDPTEVTKPPGDDAAQTRSADVATNNSQVSNLDEQDGPPGEQSDPPNPPLLPPEEPEEAVPPICHSTEDTRPPGDAASQTQSDDVATDSSQVSRFAEQDGRAREQSESQLLRDLLDSRGKSYDMLWNEFMRLKPIDRPQFRAGVIVRLGKSDNSVDAKRVSELYPLLAPEEWTQEVVKAAVRAKLVLRDEEAALKIYEEALYQRAIGQGIDLMLSHGFSTGARDFVTKLLPLHSTAVDTCGEIEYTELSKLPHFARRMAQLRTHIRRLGSDTTTTQLLQHLSRLLLRLARTSLTSFAAPADANYILLHAKDATAFQSYIAFCVREKRFQQAALLYRSYRALPGVQLPLDILRSMLDVFSDDIPQIEMVMKDYARFHRRLDAKAIMKIMPMYARRGDVESVNYLAGEWAAVSPQSLQIDPVPCIANQMHAHAVRGEPEEARRLLDETTTMLGRPAGPILWNILINAYTKAYDYDGAVRALQELSAVETPDSISYGTVMNFAAFRGDLESTVELYTMATERGINPDIPMIDAVLEAYCQNEKLAEAEGLCVKMTRTRPVEGEYVALWNTLLRHLANRRDLNGVNRALETMKEYGVHYDNDTYSHLLTGLVNCRQSHHALQFLRTSVQHNIFRPTYDHYMLLMAAFVQSREPHMVLAINDRLKNLHIPGSPKQVMAVVKALEVWSKMPASRRDGKDGREYIARALKEFWEFIKTASPATTKDFESTTGVFSRLIFILTQLRDFTSVQELIALFQRQFPDHSGVETLPVLLLHNLMLADFYEKKYDSVKATWEVVLERSIREGKPPGLQLATKSGSPAEREKVLPAYRFWLSKPLQTMQRIYLNEVDADGLIALVARVREAGFELDRMNWNYHIQALASLGRWREAFVVFEKHLMPSWTGWARARSADMTTKNQLPLEARRLGAYPRKLRPLSETIVLLLREFRDLERRAVFSKDASRQLEDIIKACPRVVQAMGGYAPGRTELEVELLEGSAEVDLGDGKKRKSVVEDYFEKVLLSRLGVKEEEEGSESEAPLVDTLAPGASTEGSPDANQAVGASAQEGEPQGESAPVEEDQEWEDVPQPQPKMKKEKARKYKGLKWIKNPTV